MTAPPRTGWYGKLPTLGDFASRRLSPELIEAWDAWLAHGIARWREHDPDNWLAAYLAGPTWRFLLTPGLLPGIGKPIVGVLMPSVDRVGRYFPLTMLRELEPGGTLGTGAQLSWLHQLDDLAVDAMQEDWEIEQLETELEKLDAVDLASEPDDITELPSLYTGQSCWWRTGDVGQRLCFCTDGLPQDAAFVALLSGQAGSATET